MTTEDLQLRTDVKIWRSSVISDTRAYAPLAYHISKELQPVFQRGRDLSSVLDAKDVPKYLYFEYYDLPPSKLNNLKDIFTIYGGVLVVTEKFKSVLDEFDMGTNQFFPVPVYKHDQETRLDHSCYILHVTEKKKCFLPEYSKNVKSFAGGKVWAPRRNDVIAVNVSSAEGPDLWRDPLLDERLFLSDQLAQALKAAKLKIPNIGLAPCKVMSSN